MLDPSPEAAVIGIALNDRRALDDLDLLEPNDFRDERLEIGRASCRERV